VASSLWYRYYARGRVARTGAIYHVFERLGQHRHHDLDTELRGILREKGLRDEDPFDDIVTRCLVFDLADLTTFEGVVQRVAEKMAPRVHLSPGEIATQIMEGTRVGATPVSRGVALPHFRTERIDKTEMALVRCQQGVRMRTYDPLTHEESEEVAIHAIFFLISPEHNPAQHLRILARIAERVDEASFAMEWEQARNALELRDSLLHDERFVTLPIRAQEPSAVLIGKLLREAGIPRGCLVAMLSRDGQSFVPDGRTILQDRDELTIIGEDEGLALLRDTYLVIR
jgi:mannitol/fructose-specific phosphotransferase system IIA component (Ntr-type)